MFDHISVDPMICHGKPCIRGTRIMVWQVLDMLEAGLSFTQIRDEFPSLSDEDIRACIHYANALVKNEEIHFKESA